MNDRRRGPNPYEDLSRRTSGGGSNKGLLIGGIAIAVVAVLAVVAIFLTGGNESGGNIDAVQETAPVQVEGDPLPEYPQVPGFVAPAEQDPAVGLTPPSLTGEDFEGEPAELDPSDGTARVVLFLAHWCSHCQAEVPLIQGWVDDGNLPDDVELVAVSTGVREDQNNYPPSRWLDREGWTGEILLDDERTSAAAAWGLTGYPYMVFIDADGKVTRRGSGEVPIAEFEALVQEVSEG